MDDLRFRTPVVCQNGHKAFWYWQIKGNGPAPGEVTHIGVHDSDKCSCPKQGLGEGYLRDGPDEMFIGCYDKNTGQEIYEGDIITAAWHWTDPHTVELPGDFYDLSEFALNDELTVVGDIHKVAYITNKSVKICSCCGQPQPYPIGPGIWEFLENPALVAQGLIPEIWERVEVKRDAEGLTITPIGEKCSVFWPNNAQWRQVS